MPRTKAQTDWDKENTLMIGIHIPNSSGIPQALLDYIEDKQMTKNAFVIQAIKEKLIREEYNPEDYKTQK